MKSYLSEREPLLYQNDKLRLRSSPLVIHDVFQIDNTAQTDGMDFEIGKFIRMKLQIRIYIYMKK